MHNSLYWRRNLGTGSTPGTTVSAMVTGIAEIVAITGTVNPAMATGIVAAPLITAAVKIEPVTGITDPTIIEGSAGC